MPDHPFSMAAAADLAFGMTPPARSADRAPACDRCGDEGFALIATGEVVCADHHLDTGDHYTPVLVCEPRFTLRQVVG